MAGGPDVVSPRPVDEIALEKSIFLLFGCFLFLTFLRENINLWSKGETKGKRRGDEL
jgi:hypothetical protein